MTTPTPIDVVLYHHPCTDGAASAYVLSRYCRRVFGTEPLCIGVFAGGVGPEDARIQDKAVVAVDVLPLNHAAIAALARSFLVLDHHEGSAAVLAEVDYGVYADKGLSGVGMAWQHCYGTGTALPLPLQYVQERDLYTFSCTESRHVSVAVQALLDIFDLPYFFAKMDGLLEEASEQLHTYAAFGALYDEMLTRRAQAMLKTACPRTLTIDDKSFRCFVFNALPDLVSYLGDAGMAVPGIDFVCVWRHGGATSGTPFTVSLRSTDAAADTIPLAKALGTKFGRGPGSGHRNASGFSTLCLPEVMFV